MADLVSNAIAREEALERAEKTAVRRERAEADHRANRAKIDLKLGSEIKAAMKTGLTAKQISRRINLSVARVYQLRDAYQDHIDQEYS